MHASLIDIDYYLPASKRDNQAVARQSSGEVPDVVFRASGVRMRSVAAPGEAPSDMAFAAARKLLERHPDRVSSIDCLIFCSYIPDSRAPATAVLLHKRLGLTQDCLAIDVPGGCAGFTNALVMAKALVCSAEASNVLLLTAEAVTTTIDHDPVLMSIFGDGAAAALVVASEQSGIGRFCKGTDGGGAPHLFVAGGGARAPMESLPFGKLHMNGEQMLKFSLRCVPRLVEQVLSVNRLTRDDIDLYIFHQASGFMLSALRKKCRIPEDKFFVCLEDMANTVSSTIPIALKNALDNEVLRPGMRVMVLGFGLGFSWSGTVLVWPRRGDDDG